MFAPWGQECITCLTTEVLTHMTLLPPPPNTKLSQQNVAKPPLPFFPHTTDFEEVCNFIWRRACRAVLWKMTITVPVERREQRTFMSHMRDKSVKPVSFQSNTLVLFASQTCNAYERRCGGSM